MYINFQQNRVSRSVKTVHTNIFANNRKLHKFATTNSNFEKKIDYFRHASSCNVHVNPFSANSGLWISQNRACSQIYFQIMTGCIILQLPIVILTKNN